MLNTDKAITKKLKHDINQKNAMRREIERLILVVKRWNEKLSRSKSFQEQSRYSASIKNYIEKIDNLRSQLILMNEDIDKRIRETGTCSTSEVEDFKSRLGKEVRDLSVDDGIDEKKPIKRQAGTGRKKSQKKIIGKKGTDRLLKKMDRLQKKIDNTRKRLDSDISETERVTGRITKLNRGLAMVGTGDQPGNLTAESRNSYLFTQELKRIERERLVFGG